MTAIDDRGEILTVGRHAADLREQGKSWSEVVDELNESSLSYVQGAHRVYLADVDARAHENQTALF